MGSVQLLRCMMVHGVTVCFTRTHTRVAAARLDSGRLGRRAIWANVSAFRVREATWATDFICD